MTKRERLQNTLAGKPVDRPPVSFYELDGYSQDPDNDDPFNIYSDPSWKPLLDLAREKTDAIYRHGAPWKNAPEDPLAELTTTETEEKDGSLYTTQTIKAGSRTLVKRTRRDPDVDTVWHLEHLLKDVEDLKAYLELPEPVFGGEPDTDVILEAEKRVGDGGIALIDIGDPICSASLFAMEDYTIIAFSEPGLFHKLLERAARICHPKAEALAKALPNRLWRVVGSEYASEPYLPPHLYEEYWARYTGPMIKSIEKYGGTARVHSHGNLKNILDIIVSTGCTGLDPVEPPPQGDVSLKYVREKYGKQLILFGNLEVSDIEQLDSDAMAEKVKTALEEGTSGEGKGFVLMPSASPYGRELSPKTLKNYETIIETLEQW
jgi:hypothetical protein